MAVVDRKRNTEARTEPRTWEREQERLAEEYARVVAYLQEHPNLPWRQIATACGLEPSRVENWTRFGLKSLGLPPLRRPGAAPAPQQPPPQAPPVAGSLASRPRPLPTAPIDIATRAAAVTALHADLEALADNPLFGRYGDRQTSRKLETMAAYYMGVSAAEGAIGAAQLGAKRIAAIEAGYVELEESRAVADPDTWDVHRYIASIAVLDACVQRLGDLPMRAALFERKVYGDPDITVQHHLTVATLPIEELHAKLDRAMATVARVRAGEIEIIDETPA